MALETSTPAGQNGTSHAPMNGNTKQLAPSASARLSDSTLRSWLRDMILIREFENRCAQAYQQAKIGGFCHLYIGQEALAVATIQALNHDDPIVTAYRDHGHALARGMSPRACMAEMFGKAAGCAKGKGGSMHMFDKPNWVFGGHGIVGAQTPLGTGLAFAARYEWEVMKTGKKKVSLAFLGDGALNQGALHEAMNLAGLWDIPVIYIVENNRYSMGTAIERGTTMAHDLLAKARAYGIAGLEISDRTTEGMAPGGEMNILNIFDLFKPFADRCREEQKPGFVDLHTYRYQGHSMSDPQKYRTKDEVEGVKSRDSIELLAQHLLMQRKCLSESALQEMTDECKALAVDALDFAEAAPLPEASELYTDVYAEPQPGLSPSCEYTQGAKNPLL
ncbi:MAG: pyruvate dehydrogenase (acetyl-transferring) E1 component subunit alpha [Phycisphaerales bacterium]